VAGLEDVAYFLALVRDGSLVSAARRLGVSHTTVGRRVRALEREVGCRLFDKTRDGWLPTDDGRRMVAHAEEAEAALGRALGEVGAPHRGLEGTVRVAATDGIGNAWLAPWLATLHERHPGVRPELVTASRLLPFTSREFDVAVTIHRTDAPSVGVRRLVDYTLGLYASPAHLARTGTPRSTGDLAGRPFVWFVRSLLDLPELQLLPLVPGVRVVAETSTVTAQQAAVAAGIGLGLLPRFMADRDPGLVRVLDEGPDAVEAARTFWLLVPAESARQARVRAVVDLLVERARADADVFAGRPVRRG